MEDKYYTPELEEIHVGCEVYMPMDGQSDLVLCAINHPNFCQFLDCKYGDPVTYSIPEILKMKYLDERDIKEAIGWVDLGGAELRGYSNLSETMKVWLSKGFTISWDRSNPIFIEISQGGVFCYRGQCKNISKLKMILKDIEA